MVNFINNLEIFFPSVPNLKTGGISTQKTSKMSLVKTHNMNNDLTTSFINYLVRKN